MSESESKGASEPVSHTHHLSSFAHKNAKIKHGWSAESNTRGNRTVSGAARVRKDKFHVGCPQQKVRRVSCAALLKQNEETTIKVVLYLRSAADRWEAFKGEDQRAALFDTNDDICTYLNILRPTIFLLFMYAISLAGSFLDEVATVTWVTWVCINAAPSIVLLELIQAPKQGNNSHKAL